MSIFVVVNWLISMHRFLICINVTNCIVVIIRFITLLKYKCADAMEITV
jgi:hypothetical protein